MRRPKAKRMAVIAAGIAAVLLVVAATRDERLSDGDILVDTIPVEGAEFPRVRVQGVVDAPPAAVWDVVRDCKASQRVNSRVKTSRIVRRVDDGVVCYELVGMPFPFKDMTTITRWSFDEGPPKWTRSWTLVEGDFDYSNGSWTLSEFEDGKTLAVYENHFKPQMAVPDWLAKAFLKVGMPGLMKDLRRSAEE